jgi:hypothetical protein
MKSKLILYVSIKKMAQQILQLTDTFNAAYLRDVAVDFSVCNAKLIFQFHGENC